MWAVLPLCLIWPIFYSTPIQWGSQTTASASVVQPTRELVTPHILVVAKKLKGHRRANIPLWCVVRIKQWTQCFNPKHHPWSVSPRTDMRKSQMHRSLKNTHQCCGRFRHQGKMRWKTQRWEVWLRWWTSCWIFWLIKRNLLKCIGEKEAGPMDAEDRLC